MRGFIVAVLALGLAFGLLALPSPNEERQPSEAAEATAPETGAAVQANDACPGATELRNPYFGDLHVHTSFSFDAWTFDTRVTPDRAYAIARRDEARLSALDREAIGSSSTRLARPLDFAAVTDHGELLAETLLCTDPTSAVYDRSACSAYRSDGDGKVSTRTRMFVLGQFLISQRPARFASICGADGSRCRAAVSDAWRQTLEAAERWNDPCHFTTFAGYEYTASPGGHNLHRNVIFRNSSVPAMPVTYVEESTPQGLWKKLKATCTDAEGGCEVLTIPHNSNYSHGRMFAVEYPGARTVAEQAEQAAFRAQMEPLVEIMQIKGDSECRNGLGGLIGAADELCDFEKIPPVHLPIVECPEGGGDTSAGDFDAVDPGSGNWEPVVGGILSAIGKGGCVSRLDFVRNVLAEGLLEADRIGVNPYKLGIIGSTDTHDGTPGRVDEAAYQSLDKTRSPGGLVAVWATENSRDAIFSGMKRRETYGTSGPRISARFFGGWSYPDDLCEDAQMVARGYAEGVPMGGDLPPRPDHAEAPIFVVSALRDPGTAELPGSLLQRLQIIKGWVDGEGRARQSVLDVAGSADNGASVDLETCTPRGPGSASACAVWRDPDFEPAKRAFYYARVVENPSCRYSSYECIGTAPGSQPAHCADPTVPKTVQERAWTSPIWYEPGGAATRRAPGPHPAN